MARVVWTPQALADLRAVREFVTRDSVHYADMLADRLFVAVERLETFPMSGRMVPEIESEEIRELIVSGYRIVYRIYEDEVSILTVSHAARLLDEASLSDEDAP